MRIQKTCPYCGGRGYIITHIEVLPDCGRAWTKRCIACEGTGLILYTETNADHIRAMSDEELAKSRVIDYEGYPGTYLAIDCEKVFYSEEEAIAAELEWLQQPAEEGE